MDLDLLLNHELAFPSTEVQSSLFRRLALNSILLSLWCVMNHIASLIDALNRSGPSSVDVYHFFLFMFRALLV